MSFDCPICNLPKAVLFHIEHDGEGYYAVDLALQYCDCPLTAEQQGEMEREAWSSIHMD